MCITQIISAKINEKILKKLLLSKNFDPDVTQTRKLEIKQESWKNKIFGNEQILEIFQFFFSGIRSQASPLGNQ